VAAEFVVVYGQQFVVVHDLGKVRGTYRAHLALLVVMVVDALVEAYSGLHDRFDVDGIVFSAGELRALHDYCDYVLVAEYGAAAAAPRLLEPDGFSAYVIEAEVEPDDVARLRRHTCGDDGYRALVLFVLRKVVVELLGNVVRVVVFEGRLEYLDFIVVAVDENYDRPVGLALDLKRVEARELEEGAEVSPCVAVVGLFRGRGEEYGV